jgi:predicted ATPase/DNA-binding XRE family transcriptional regulator
MEKTESFGYWVRRRRKALDLTQEMLAQCVGCAAVTLRKIEADERHPSRQMAERLAHCLGLSEDEKRAFLEVCGRKVSPGRLALPTKPEIDLIPSNLPAPATPLVGREAELTAIQECLQRKGIRFHTLTGPVGVGKTRLAIEAGYRLRHKFRDGVTLVMLGAIQDPALAPSATAAALGVREIQNKTLEEAVAASLAKKEMLLIFDNFEHLPEAASFLSMLMAAAPKVCFLVTSRTCLHIYGEHEFIVPPMPLPQSSNLSEAQDSEAVRLFCARAQAARADFRCTPDLLPTVVEICRRLDGLPLAIELAAARVKLFSPHELLLRLERRLPLLAQARMDLPPRSWTLENAIAWSVGLLSASERLLFQRLAVFTGGLTLSAAERVCTFSAVEQTPVEQRPATLEVSEIASSLSTLIDHSLLMRQKTSAPDAETRFFMLEILREFSRERLIEGCELEYFQRRHAQYFASWIEQAETHLYGSEQARWLGLIEVEADNLRTALGQSLASSQLETAAHIACTFAVFWRRRDFYSEGRYWLEQILQHPKAAHMAANLQAKTLLAVGALATRQGDLTSAQAWLEESLALFEVLQDQAGIARVLFELGWIAIDQEQWEHAARLNQDSLALARLANDLLGVYRALTNLGWIKLSNGECDLAAALFDEAYGLVTQIGHTKGIAVSLLNLGWIAISRGELETAIHRALESLHLYHELGEREGLAEGLEILAVVAAESKSYERAAWLSGAVQAIWDSLEISRSPGHYSTSAYQAALQLTKQDLSYYTFTTAWSKGYSTPVELFPEIVLT